MAFIITSANTLRSQKKSRKGQEGQLVLEYVLLLSVVATIGMLFILLLVGRGNQTEQGAQRGLIVQQWMAIVNTVSQDLPDN